jgi:ligand-binding sensor domain-containing protein/two-component sensor histidine kinase
MVRPLAKTDSSQPHPYRCGFSLNRPIFWLILSFLLVSAPPITPAQKLPFKNYSTKDGLIHNNVRCLCQDSLGYLWVGTTEGISRFDGAAFSSYVLKQDTLSSRSGPLGTYVNAFLEDREKTLWIGLNMNGGLARFNRFDQTFTRYKFSPDSSSLSNWVNAVLQDVEGTIWIGTDDGLFRFEGGVFRRSYADVLGPSVPIQALYEDGHGTIWIATSLGLFQRGPKAGTELIHIDGLRGIQFNRLMEGKEGVLWIGTDDIGLIRLETLSHGGRPSFHFSSYTTANGLPSNTVHDILLDDSGILWLATQAGLCKFDLATKQIVTYTTANGLPSDNLFSILQDQEKNIWMGSSKGISKLTGETFANYGEVEGLPFESSLRMSSARDDKLWFVGNGGACYFKGGAFIVVEALRGGYILSVAVEKNGAVWFGTGDGATRWEKGKVVSHYTSKNGLGADRIHYVFQDSRGAMWFGHENGASRLYQGKFCHFKSPLIVGIAEDRDSTLWFASWSNGIYKLPKASLWNGDWTAVRIPIDIRTRAIICDEENKLWIGTRLNGVYRYDPESGSLMNYTTANGLSSNFVHSIFQDSKGDFWFGTTRGVNRFDGNKMRQYSTRDGLAGDDVFCSVEDKQGYLWFATGTGISRYNRAQERAVYLPPPVHVTRFQIFGEEVPLREGTVLSAHQHSVSFDYVGISFKDETQLRYQYCLRGLDQTWSELTERHFVNYTNLSPGEYTFEVRARNVDGVWSAQPAVFSFTIASPIWKRWWFLALSAVALAGLVISIYKYRINRLLGLERMRSRIATDLHDEIGTSLSSLALISEMTRRDTPPDSPRVSERLKSISETARRLVDTMHDIVWSIDPNKDTLEDIVLYMRQYAAEVLETKGIEFQFITPTDTKSLSLAMDVRHHLYLIFKEGINNIVRHSGCSRVDISVRLQQRKLIFEIKDNGCGFNRSEIGAGNGLKNMRSRARAIRTALTIDTRPGEGTKIALEVPLNPPR